MPRLPIPGQDKGSWGDVLNDFLAQAHNTDGTLRSNIITPTTLNAGSPSTGQVLTYDGSSLSWSTASGSGAVADASGITKGLVQLTGDLGGTASSPTVPGLASKANTSHVHAITDISNLQTTLDGKQVAGSYVATTDLTSGLAGKSDATHTHTISQISDSTTIGRAILAAADAAAVRSAIGAGLSNLVIGTTTGTAADAATVTASLSAKAATVHTHVATDITSGMFDIAQMPAGTVLYSESVVTRPTNRTDIRVFFLTPTDPSAVMITGDEWHRRT